MKEILIFFKYSLFAGYNEKRHTRKNFLLVGTLGTVVSAAMIYYPIFKVMDLVKDLKISGINAGEFTASLYSFIFSILVLLGSILSGTEVFLSFKGLEFLLSLPVRRQNIFAYTYIVEMISGAWSLGFLESLAIARAEIFGGSLIASTMASLLHYTFLSSFGALFSASIRRYVKSPILRRILYVTLSVLLLLVVFLVNGSSRSITAALKKLKSVSEFLSSPYNILRFPVNPSLFQASLEVLGIISIYTLFTGVVRRIENEAKAALKRGVVKGGISLVGKELKLLFRTERGFLYLLYPYLFALIIGWGQDPVYTMSTALPLIAIYSPSLSKELMNQDLISWDYLRSLPLDLKKIITPKVISITLVGFSLSLMFWLATGLFKGFSIVPAVIATYSTVIYASVSNVGILESVDGGNTKFSTMIRALPITISTLGVIVGLATPNRIWGIPLAAFSMSIPPIFGVIFFKRSLARLKNL